MNRRVLRSPWLHFLGGALLLLAGRSWWPRHLAPAGAPPSDDALLLRAAFDLGLDRRDAAVAGRLAKLGRFIGEDSADERQLVAEARRLGLERSDVVIQRHLTQMMRLAAEQVPAVDRPTGTDLRAYRDAHAGVFTAPARVQLSHVFLSRERHGARLTADANELLERLRSEGTAPTDAARYGDGFLGGHTVGPFTAEEIDRRLGPGVAAQLDRPPIGAWAGPVSSSYGLHLVWIHARTAPTTPDLAAIQGQVLHRWLRDQRQRRLQARLAQLRTSTPP